MGAKWAWVLSAALSGGALAAHGCGTEEITDDDGGGKKSSAQTGGDPTAPPQQPGERCNCDADCAGDEALCLLGMCARRASMPCTAPNTEAGCDPGFRCFNTELVAGTGVCLPLHDPASCAIAKSRHGVCSPTRLDFCDKTCAATCELPATTEAATAGAACDYDEDCTFHAQASCYADPGYGEPTGWVDGYCLAFGCTSDAECGAADKGCFPVASDGSGVCMERCGWDMDCRAGYLCRTLEDGVSSMCFAGCDAAATCPSGYACLGEICVSETLACGPKNPTGWCPDGAWCDEGVCKKEPFACAGEDDTLEDNDSLAKATKAPLGKTEGLRSCSGDEDWYRVDVPPGKLVRAGIRFVNNAGDLDLVAYDAAGALLGSRVGTVYPYAFRDYETNTEYYGFYSQKGDTYYLRVAGYGTSENAYVLEVSEHDWKDGASCTDAGFSFDDCAGHGDDGAGLLPMPFPDPKDDFVGAQLYSETVANYRFARRELIMLVRHAMAETTKAFADTKPLALLDICQIDGITPGYDIGDPRHPETTHDQGGNIDIAYFQTDGQNDGAIICGDGSQHADGFCSPAAKDKHIVDLPRQAFFMAKLYGSTRTRVIGADVVIGPLVREAAKALAALPEGDPKRISSAELAGFNGKLAYGDGWPYHHHHIHVSLHWWVGQSWNEGQGGSGGTEGGGAHVMHRPGFTPRSRPAMRWPTPAARPETAPAR
jgi:hypothetical protein